MNDYKKEVEYMMECLIRLRETYRAELEKCPAGRLWKSMHQNKPRYFRAYRCGDRYVRKSISGDEGMKQALARKAFLEKNLRRIDRNIDVLRRASRGMISLDSEEVVQALPKSYQTLPFAFFVGEEDAGQIDLFE